MESYNDGWLYSGSASERLWNKSAIGKKMKGNKLLLSAAEVIFCHEHRHLDWPSESWFECEILENPDLINESIIIEALRVPGNKIVLTKFLEENQFDFSEDTWGIRWNSDNHPRKDQPESEVRWFHSSSIIDRENLLLWATNVTKKGRIAEVLIVDNEQAVVTYNITSENPKGSLIPPSENIIEEIKNYKRTKIDNQKTFIHYEGLWPCDQIGIDYNQGRIIDNVSEKFLLSTEKDWNAETSLFSELLKRGLHPRPGFKYGTLWRCYDQKIGNDHAPWLIVTPSKQPINWENACLASRLAAGVNKIWLQPLKINQIWDFLAILRPPANARWTNPNRK